MDEEGRVGRNERKRKLYADLAPADKAAILLRRRTQYAQRKSARIALAAVPLSTCESSSTNSSSTLVSPTLSTLNARRFQERGFVKGSDYPHEGVRAQLRSEMLSHGPAANVQNVILSLLPAAPRCCYCLAFRFFHETACFCCYKGEIQLVNPEMPPDLRSLFLDNNPESIAFRKYARSYNNNLAFTTFSARKDNELLKNHLGVYTFKVQGKIHHFLNPLNPSAGIHVPPSGIQLYMYDPDTQIEERLKSSTYFEKRTMLRLSKILSSNPYVRFLTQLRSLPGLDSCRLYLVKDPKLDQRVYNEPTTTDVAAIIHQDDDADLNPQCHIQIYSKDGQAHRVCHNYGSYDPLQYPLLFPNGHTGWHYGIERLPSNDVSGQPACGMLLPLINEDVTNAEQLVDREEAAMVRARRKRNVVSAREYYCYKLQIRHADNSMLLHTGRLFQQYIVDMFVKIETSRLEYFYKHRENMRTEAFQGLLDSVAAGNHKCCDVGKRIILPPSFVGGPRDMRKRYLDAMALVQQLGKPDFFLTITCNPSWPEISAHLLPGELPQNRPDLLSRVFKAKLELLKKDLVQDQLFGKTQAFVYSIEFQKRGLPHAHLLIIMDRESKPLNSEAYDRFVCAELPDPVLNPALHALVLKHMIHGPCGALNRASPCMHDEKCKNRFPKEFQESTIHGADTYPQYRRRNNGITAIVRRQQIDNRWVVPYNPYLLQKFDCHINIEICSTIKLVKYIYKYIYKGPDKIAFQLINSTPDDEIKEYQSGRWVGPPEAAWRIYAFDLFEIYPAVIALQLHLPNNHYVSFKSKEDLATVVGNTFLERTMLTEFFWMNRHHDSAKNLQLLYRDFPKFFVWDSSKRSWALRKRGKVVGRIVSAGPVEGERYYLRLLLGHVRAPHSFEALQTVDGRFYGNFRDAALARDLLATDMDLDKCLEEAEVFQMPRQLRFLFASILAYSSPTNPRLLWEKYRDSLTDDYRRSSNLPVSFPSSPIRKALEDIDSWLQAIGRQISDFHLGPDVVFLGFTRKPARDLLFERNIFVSPADIRAVDALNAGQRAAYDTIMSNLNNEIQSSYFIDGAGGTGKTFLYKALMGTLRAAGYIVLATATSGVAACVLPGGRTAHSRFNLPLQDDIGGIARVSKQSSTAQLIRESRIIIWDESPMAHRDAVEAFAAMLEDVTDVDAPFGNKTVLFGGDFRQVLPVVPRGTRADQILASLFHSTIWPRLTGIQLTENMRAHADPAFADYLLRIGNGIEPTDENGNIELPSQIVIPYIQEEQSLQQLIQFVYPQMESFATGGDAIMERVLLAPMNNCVDELNHTILNRAPGTAVTYFSTDITLDPQHQGDYEDLLHSASPSSLPPHELTLKVHSPIVLLRNLKPTEGLCNGTRLLCKELKGHIIVAEIATGPFKGDITILHKIPLEASNSERFGVPFKRYQFPVRLAYAMTINKAQGQTLDRVGVYLREPVFSHGQLYVAFSRVRKFDSLKVLITPPTFAEQVATNKTQNIVYDEIIQAI